MSNENEAAFVTASIFCILIQLLLFLMQYNALVGGFMSVSCAAAQY